jgi:hypothetical protein
MDDTELGTLTRPGDRWMLTFTRRLAHPREKGPDAATIGPPPGHDPRRAERGSSGVSA